MKTILIMVILFVTNLSFAATDTAAAGAEITPAAPTKKKVALDADTKTNHSFEDLLVQGQYHFSDEAVMTVEEDKVLDALIGVRADFKDRLKKSSANR